jgi:uncharacterized protein YebE (UPF0316 family)
MHLPTLDLLAALSKPLTGFGLEWSLFPAWLVTPLIFLLRTCDLTLSTMKVLFVVRGRRAVTWLIAVTQGFLFVIGIAGVISSLHQPLNLLAYALGFATGTLTGMLIEGRIAPGHSLLRITSPARGAAILHELHRSELGATEIPASGRDGTVSVIYSFVPRKKVDQTVQIVNNLDPEAFLSVVDVRSLRGGWRA